MQAIHLALDQHAIRFTPDGKIAVIDAITALSDLTDAKHIWRGLSQNHPEIITLCDTYHFKKAESTPVANVENWEKIQGFLFEYLIEESLTAVEES
ncbi:MAG: hypothetical protein C4519_02290 [Desulfobacteraceae bacterium]|nr:MAG: hypothetical protein C4519_02290 [Desulfobacteraceae bacterium]